MWQHNAAPIPPGMLRPDDREALLHSFIVTNPSKPMNPTNPSSPLNPPLQAAADKAAATASSALETGREKLEEARQFAQQKMEVVSEKAGEAMHVARQKVESAGSNLLQWARENPATALATFFASGFVIGCALTMQRHEKTFGERLRDDPSATLRDAFASALAPLRDRVHDASDSVQSAVEKVVDRVASNGHSLGSRIRHLWN